MKKENKKPLSTDRVKQKHPIALGFLYEPSDSIKKTFPNCIGVMITTDEYYEKTAHLHH